MLATFMEVLDTSIANVALPHIAGTLSASTDESTWVLTSYLVSNAIVLPATGWLGRRFGRKNFLIACIGIFTLASVLCGAATSLGMLIFARILQGAGGGALQPIAQAVMLESFPREKRGAAMAAYGMGVVVAPIIGPTLGGWITDTYSWRWTFYINLPVGILAALMAQWFVEDPPYIKNAKAGAIDYLGFGFLALWLSSLQIMLDKGQQEDWFNSPFIVGLAALSVASLVAFVVRELTADEPIVDLRVLANRNFVTGTGLIFAVGVVLYGTIALLPLFLQTLMGYPALQSGMAVSPRGLGSIAAMLIVGRLIGRVDTRWLMGIGFAVLAVSGFMFGNLSLDITPWHVLVPNVLNGFGVGFIFVPLSTTAMATLSNTQMGNATGIYNLMRNLGGGVGIALVTTVLARSAQSHQALMSSHLSPYDPAMRERVETMTRVFSQHADPVTAAHQAYASVYGTLVQQSTLWAYVSDFRLLAILCLACVPFVFVLKRAKGKGPAVAAH
jgi:DHA2 family multidrug resistance protein